MSPALSHCSGILGSARTDTVIGLHAMNHSIGYLGREEMYDAAYESEVEVNTSSVSSSRFDNLMLRSLVQAVGDKAGDAIFTPGDVADWFGVSYRTAQEWLGEWRGEGLVESASGAARVSTWRLAGAAGAAARGVPAELIAEPREGE